MDKHIFISYTRKDVDFAQRIHADLAEKGIPAWIDQVGIRGGAEWPDTIANALQQSIGLIVILSPDSMKSEWVKRELAFADQEGITIFPLLHVETELPAPYRLRFGHLQWIDFSREDYRKSFEKLLNSIEETLGITPAKPKKEKAPEKTLPKGNEPTLQISLSSNLLGDAFTVNDIEFLRIREGKFLMGSDPSYDPGAYKNEQPQHEVSLAEYYISKYPIIYRDYSPYANKDVYWTEPPEFNIPEGKHKHPIVKVSWYNADLFCDWLTGKLFSDKYDPNDKDFLKQAPKSVVSSLISQKKWRFMLPSEAQWEKAARGQNGRIYPWGNKFESRNCRGRNAATFFTMSTEEVGHYSTRGDSPYGAADMSGNVYEWCRNLYMDYPYIPDHERLDHDRQKNFGIGDFVARGGSYFSGPKELRCAYRHILRPDTKSDEVGFRVVFAPPSEVNS